MRRRRHGFPIGMLWLLLISAPAPVGGQECDVDRGPGHDDWHESRRAIFAFQDELEAILEGVGQPALGSLVLRRAADGGVDVRRLMLTVPPTAEEAFNQVLGRMIESPDVESASEVGIDFGAPRIDLWPDRTERCEAEMDNVAEAGGLLAQVVAGAIQREGKAKPAGRVRFELALLVDWTGRVSEIEFREDPGAWAWLVPYLEALAPALRYRPATLNGTPITTWVPEQFELEF